MRTRKLKRKLVIGGVGLIHAGKGDTAKIIQRFFKKRGVSCVRMSFSDDLKKWLHDKGIPVGRFNLQTMAKIIHETPWEGLDDPNVILSRAVARRIQRSKADVVIMDGLRWDPYDHDMIRSFSSNSIFVIDAPLEMIRDRMAKSPHFAGIELTDAKFEEIMSQRAERDIPTLMKKGDYIIMNDGPKKHLKAKVLGYCESVLWPKFSKLD